MQYASLILVTLAFFSVSHAFGWGATGHRAVGLIAERHLSARARSEVKALLGRETLARASTWGDEVRSDPAFKFQDPWHYVNLPPDKKYDPAKGASGGDILKALAKARSEIGDKSLAREKRIQALRLFVHLVGDVHQPLHATATNDMGGNLCNVSFMGNATNLHALWDDGLIDQSSLSYTELADFVDANKITDTVSGENGVFLEWALESANAADKVYPGPADRPYCRKAFDAPVAPAADQPKLDWVYRYRHWPLLEKRLQLAGLRLAAQLNAIFKSGN